MLLFFFFVFLVLLHVSFFIYNILKRAYCEILSPKETWDTNSYYDISRIKNITVSKLLVAGVCLLADQHLWLEDVMESS